MAAGVGSRLDPLTKDVPKPLVPVLNKPVMDILLEKLKDFGIESVIANTHYLAEQIQHRYTHNSPVNINFHYLHEETLSGTAGGVKKCEYFFKDVDDFIVVSADGLHDADLNRIVKSHYDEDAEYLVDKIKKLLKSDIQRENVEKCRFSGIDMI